MTSPPAEASKASLISGKAKVLVSFSIGNFPCCHNWISWGMKT